MTFEERLRRNAPEDQIKIGEVVEAALSGEFGVLLKAIISGIIAAELDKSRRDKNVSADRVLGRIESLDNLTEQLDTTVDIKRQLTEELKGSIEVNPVAAPKG